MTAPDYPIGARVICEATPHSREMEGVVVTVDGDRRKIAFADHALTGSRDVSQLRPHPECLIARLRRHAALEVARG